MRLMKRDAYFGRGLGMWAFWFHRLSGLLILFYLLLHVLVISSVVSGKTNFDHTMVFLKNPVFVALEIGLIGTILVHGLNGVRLLLFDLGYGIKRQKEIFAALMAVGVIPLGIAAVVAWPHIFQ